MRHVLIINVFSTLNKGDAAIALSQIGMVRKLWPSVEITVQSWNPETDAPHFDCPVVGPFFDMVSEKHPDWSRYRRLYHTGSLLAKTMTGARLARIFGRTPGLGLPPAARQALHAYRRADLVISVGGNFLYAYEGKNSFSFLKHCHQIAIAQAMGKPVLLLAQSFGPVQSPRLRNFLRKIVNRSTRVLVREELSQSFLKEIGARLDHVQITPDSAFLLPPDSAQAAEAKLTEFGIPSGALRIGMTVRKWEYPNSPNPEALSKEFPKHIARCIDWMIESWGVHVLLLPQCITPDADDRICMHEVQAHVRHKANVVCVEEDLSPSLLKAICGRLDLFIGTRMHSNIFATAMATPTLAISYQPKTDGIMKMLGMDRWRILIEDVTSDALQELLTKLWLARGDVRAQLGIRIAEMQESALNDLEAVLVSLGAITGSV